MRKLILGLSLLSIASVSFASAPTDSTEIQAWVFHYGFTYLIQLPYAGIP